ncbi:methionine ABC transporter substrate-binding protein [Aeromicrobium sp. CFBP 8757]|uniref:MetQ/NlpA family ABC transporter substrate-binding protein n=1 Tax=Aeromicrobium sp. CFBP 8757 TaxID=2775288 RepID=UPI00177F6A84|nr:MetQ/NlpA family ABC transporter substrate-binding protein [Aeromicrobium sp. CFBP 8757]MBD8606674.1 methionine ABC transporter substrate-binding protein [Aeromicrobium sp. CFBP 8757]
MSDQLIEAPKKKRGGLIAVVAIVVIAIIAAVAYALTSGDDDTSSAAGTSGKTVRIGVVGASDPYWDVYQKAAADEGISVDIVDFTDYTQPNPALDADELDLNQFQHLVYLADYNVSNGKDLTPVGSTAVYPLGLYSKEYTSPDDIPAGSTVAVPDDASNQARGLRLLQTAGLITLKDGGTIFSDLADVDTDASKVKVTDLSADITATSLDDVAAAIINNDFVEKAGLTFDDAIAKDGPSEPGAAPYVNVFAARAADKDDATYRKLVEIFQDTKAVTDGLQDVSGGTAVLTKEPAADLQSLLASVEKDTEASK